jgi:hypothetical protein
MVPIFSVATARIALLQRSVHHYQTVYDIKLFIRSRVSLTPLNHVTHVLDVHTPSEPAPKLADGFGAESRYWRYQSQIDASGNRLESFETIRTNCRYSDTDRAAHVAAGVAAAVLCSGQEGFRQELCCVYRPCDRYYER